jgi:hypothetical protein
LYRNLRQKAAVYAFTPFELMTLNLSNGDDWHTRMNTSITPDLNIRSAGRVQNRQNHV